MSNFKKIGIQNLVLELYRYNGHTRNRANY